MGDVAKLIARPDEYELEMARVLGLEFDKTVAGSVRTVEPQCAEWRQVGLAERAEPLRISGTVGGEVITHSIDVTAEVYAALVRQESLRKAAWAELVRAAREKQSRD